MAVAEDLDFLVCARESIHVPGSIRLQGALFVTDRSDSRDGAEALDYLFARGTFQDCDVGNLAVVLRDLNLSKPDEHLRHTPVPMLTSSRAERDCVRSLDVNAVVAKPVGFDRFFETICYPGMVWAVLDEPSPHRGVGLR